MLSCKDVTRLVSESLDRDLPWYRRLGVWFHLMMCKYCSRYSRQLHALRHLLHCAAEKERAPDYEPPEKLPDAASERIKRLLDEEGGGDLPS